MHVRAERQHVTKRALRRAGKLQMAIMQHIRGAFSGVAGANGYKASVSFSSAANLSASAAACASDVVLATSEDLLSLGAERRIDGNGDENVRH